VNKIATGCAIGAIMLMSASVARPDAMAAFATGGYASGLRTEAMMHKMDTTTTIWCLATSSAHKGMLGPAQYFATGGAPAH